VGRVGARRDADSARTTGLRSGRRWLSPLDSTLPFSSGRTPMHTAPRSWAAKGRSLERAQVGPALEWHGTRRVFPPPRACHGVLARLAGWILMEGTQILGPLGSNLRFDLVHPPCQKPQTALLSETFGEAGDRIRTGDPQLGNPRRANRQQPKTPYFLPFRVSSTRQQSPATVSRGTVIGTVFLS
jgi:hypothetical protein